jgi:CheY-like chemotaxis protein
MAKKIKVLVVDDEEFNLDIMTDYLEDAGFTVIQADDGDVALQKLASIPDIDVIILDRMMPRMNGMEVLENLSASPKLSCIPVIMQSGAASGEQILEGKLAGVYAYLPKPFDAAMLVWGVQAAVKDYKKSAG